MTPTQFGEALVALGYLRKDAGVSAEVTRDGDRRVVAFMMKDTAFSDAKFQFVFHARTELLSRKVYDGAPVDVWLTDNRLRPHTKLSWETRPREIDLGDHHTITYGRDAVRPRPEPSRRSSSSAATSRPGDLASRTCCTRTRGRSSGCS